MTNIVVIDGDVTKTATDNNTVIINMGDYNCDGIVEKIRTIAALMEAMDDLEMLGDDRDHAWYHTSLDDIMDRMIQTLP